MARRAAGVRKRNDGSLEKRFTIKGKRFSVYGRSADEIEQKEQQIREQIKAGTYTQNKSLTLDQYFEEWIDHKRGTVKENSIRSYKAMYQSRLSPILGKKKVRQIERREVLAAQKALSDDLKTSGVNYCIMLLGMILKEAVNDEIITRNPAQGIKAQKRTEPKAAETIHRALTLEEQRLFMDEAKTDYYYEFFALMLCTGLRCGEAAALTWNDIDYKNNVIHVTKTVTRTEESKAAIGTPKSAAGIRDIPLTETAKSILKQQRMKYGVIPMKNTRIFQRVYGGIIESADTKEALERIADRIREKGYEFERITNHCFRDTFATRFIEQGGTPQTLKTILGHSSLAMTMDLYAHVLPNTRQEEMNRIQIVV